MEFPSISVTAELRGAAPEVMEEGVTEILEEYVDTVPGLRSMKSTTFHGISVLRAEFELDIDIDAAARKVRDKVAQARKKLPDDLDPPIIAKVDPGGILIIWLPINSDRSVVDLTEYLTYSVKPFIETLPGVAGADIFGGRERAIRIWLDGKQLRARGLSANNVIVALRNEHVDIPGGRVASTAIEYSLKTVAGFETVEELSNLVIARVDGAKVYRRDVARVEDGAEALKSVSHYNGGWGGAGWGSSSNPGPRLLRFPMAPRIVSLGLPPALPRADRCDSRPLASDVSRRSRRARRARGRFRRPLGGASAFAPCFEPASERSAEEGSCVGSSNLHGSPIHLFGSYSTTYGPLGGSRLRREPPWIRASADSELDE